MAEEIITLVSKEYATGNFQSKLTEANEGDNIKITGEGDNLKISAEVPAHAKTTITTSDARVAVTETQTGYDLALNGSFIERGEYTELENTVGEHTTSITDLGNTVNTVKGDVDDLKLEVATLEQNVESNSQAITALEQSVAGKQDTLTAGENITIENNVISASGGGLTPQAVQNLFETYATMGYIKTMANMHIYYDGNICKTLPTPSPIPLPYTTNFEINECGYFPKEGYFIPMEVMVPKIVTTIDDVYIGVLPGSAKAGDTFESLFIVTHKPLGPAGTYYNVPFVYANCKDDSVGKLAGPNVSWTGWMDSERQNTVGQFIKKIVDDKEVYEFVSGVDTTSSLIPIAKSLDLQKTSGPTGCPTIIGIDGFHMVARAHQYANVPAQLSYRYAYAPYINMPLDYTTFASEYEARRIIIGDYSGDSKKIATREYVHELVVNKLLDIPWDMSYAPYQPDLP